MVTEYGSIVDVPGVKVGHADDPAAETGCTVVLFDAFDDAAAVCGVDVRGSAPGTRETDVLGATATVQRVHAVVLCGGSAFGLDAASGVASALEAAGIGFAVGPWRVPIVPAAVIFDLFSGDGRVRPDRAMGAAAVAAASRARPASGRHGAGAGARVAKLAGLDRARFGGAGSASRRHGDLVVGALAVCNAVGNVYDPRTGEAIAEPHGDGRPFDLHAALAAERGPLPLPGTNTTLAVVATNASFDRAGATKVAQMAHDGLARAVVPAHLTRDGDTIFACGAGAIAADLDLIGVLAAEAVAEAIADGVRAANAP
jgi:L-aminopeptidase/D-esterase-like protein